MVNTVSGTIVEARTTGKEKIVRTTDFAEFTGRVVSIASPLTTVPMARSDCFERMAPLLEELSLWDE